MSNKDILILSIITLITVLLWTVFEAYHVRITSTIPASLQEQINQITPTLNRDLIEKLKERIDVDSLPTPMITIPVSNSSTSANTATSSSINP